MTYSKPLKALVGIAALRSSVRAMTSEVRAPLLLLLFAACGFPRPADVGDDGGTGAPGPGITVHVSPSGDDANDGLIQPVKTLKHAIGLASENHQVTKIVLSSGIYSSSSGETFPYIVPPEVTVVGPAGGGAVLTGTRMEPGMTVAAGTLQDLDFKDFTVAITVTGTASIKNIRVGTSTVAVQAETTAKLTADNLDVTGTAGACLSGIVLHGFAALTVSSFTTRVLGTSLLVREQGTAVLTAANITGDPSCGALISIVSSGVFKLSDSILDGGADGVDIGASGATQPTQAILTNVVIRNMDASALGVGNATVTMSGGELSHTRETSFSMVGGSCSMSNVSLLSSGAAFYVQDANLMMRNCTISGNAVGGDLGVRAVGDLGTTSSPGNNVFKNSGVGLLIEGGNGAQQVQAVGNAWNPIQGADSDGKYVPGTVIPGPISCASTSNNFCIQVSDESLVL